jgi:RNA-directed DNA polymerase
VKALQWLLTHSYSGKAVAVKRVTENQGKKTPGVDGITWTKPEAKSQAVQTLKRHGYRPLPLRRLYIPKSNGKMRPLGIPTMKDRAMQALYLLALEPVAETTADRHSYGFRSARSTADAIKQCYLALAKQDRAKWILEGDIQGCFDHISHEWMMDTVPTDKTVLRKWLKAGYIENKALYPTEAGTPQGGIISPTLANMTLDGLESALYCRFKKGKQNPHKINLIRYADDFIITGATKEVLAEEVRPVVEEFLAERGLTLSPEKTRITHIDEGFDFLGFNIRKYQGILLMQPAKKSVSTFLDKIRAFVKKQQTIRQDKLIGALNPAIRGWANYYRHVAAMATFRRVSHEIWCCLWRWARRRHPNKGLRWVRKKYFCTLHGRSWEFAAPTGEMGPSGKPKLAVLRNMGDTKYCRYSKIKADANPFDPQWENYFEHREGLKMLDSLRGRGKLARLWVDQEEQCPICSKRITATTGWRVHYLLPRVEGGKGNASNLVLVHPDCHEQLHAGGLNVEKPVPARGL